MLVTAAYNARGARTAWNSTEERRSSVKRNVDAASSIVSAVDTGPCNATTNVFGLVVQVLQSSTVCVCTITAPAAPQAPKSWLAPKFSRTIDSLWSLASQKN